VEGSGKGQSLNAIMKSKRFEDAAQRLQQKFLTHFLLKSGPPEASIILKSQKIKIGWAGLKLLNSLTSAHPRSRKDPKEEHPCDAFGIIALKR